MTTWQLTVDCRDPAPLVRFWAAALGYAVTPPPEGHATWNDWYRHLGVPEDELDPDGDGSDRLHDPEGHGPRIWFQVVPEPKQGKNRLHLDLFPSGPDRSLPLTERRRVVDQRVAELVALGATVLRPGRPAEAGDDESPEGHYGVLLQDPEGNELCVA